uniref:Uncharacterized protein n=1 Tax=Trypanosoma vivax (strain Y486) TaxID=1055687 RepID=G0U7Z9_TRYVY|nr:hypothetical protein TVY486_1010500 [Trypanosoma vivax Y486]
MRFPPTSEPCPFPLFFYPMFFFFLLISPSTVLLITRLLACSSHGCVYRHILFTLRGVSGGVSEGSHGAWVFSSPFALSRRATLYRLSSGFPHVSHIFYDSHPLCHLSAGGPSLLYSVVHAFLLL